MGLSDGAEWDSSDEQDAESPQVRPRIVLPSVDILHELVNGACLVAVSGHSEAGQLRQNESEYRIFPDRGSTGGTIL